MAAISPLAGVYPNGYNKSGIAHHTGLTPNGRPANNNMHGLTAEEIRDLYHAQQLQDTSMAQQKGNPETITVRVLAFLKGSETVKNAHDIFEFDPTLSYPQLLDTLTRFLTNHSKGDPKARANLGVIFTPCHKINKIKAVWSGLAAGSGDIWAGTQTTVNPSNDVVITENNYSSIVKTLKKRDAYGNLDTLAVEVEVPEE